MGHFWCVRVGLRYRALAVEGEDSIVWFWIGTHALHIWRHTSDIARGPASGMCASLRHPTIAISSDAVHCKVKSRLIQSNEDVSHDLSWILIGEALL